MRLKNNYLALLAGLWAAQICKASDWEFVAELPELANCAQETFLWSGGAERLVACGATLWHVRPDGSSNKMSFPKGMEIRSMHVAGDMFFVVDSDREAVWTGNYTEATLQMHLSLDPKAFGDSYHPTNWISGQGESTLFVATGESNFIGTTKGGLFVSTDGGINWKVETHTNGSKIRHVHAANPSGLRAAPVFATGRKSGILGNYVVFGSFDRGYWFTSKTVDYLGKVFAGQDAGVVYDTGYAGLLRSADGFVNSKLMKRGDGLPDTAPEKYIKAAGGGVMMFFGGEASSGSRIVGSTDDGETFEIFPLPDELETWHSVDQLKAMWFDTTNSSLLAIWKGKDSNDENVAGLFRQTVEIITPPPTTGEPPSTSAAVRISPKGRGWAAFVTAALVVALTGFDRI